MGVDSSPQKDAAPASSPLQVTPPHKSSVLSNANGTDYSIAAGHAMGQLGRQALELLLPSTCRVCDECVNPGGDFCQDCLVELQSSEFLMQFACNRCGRPGAGVSKGSTMEPDVGIPSDAETTSVADRKQTCPHCEQEKLSFDRCVALWTYDGLVRTAVVASKYGSQIALAEALGNRLGHRLAAVLAEETANTASVSRDAPARESAVTEQIPDLVTAVPSHLWRRIQRGHGGSRALAASVTRTLRDDWPDAKLVNLLMTTRRIKKQAWLGVKERVSNVRGAFRVNRGWRGRRNSQPLAGKHVLLIDDVMTTGATADEITRVLKAEGASRVTVAVVARAYNG